MIDGKIAQANGRLKSVNCGVMIGLEGNRLYLRATFPPKPGSSRSMAHQQRLFLGYHINPAGLKLAEQDARVMGVLLEQGKFDWKPYVKNYVQVETVKDWVEKFEADYFTRRRRTPKTETTWRHDYLKVFGTLPKDQALTPQLLKTAIEGTEADSRTRKRFVDCCSRLAKFSGLDTDFKPLQGHYSSSSFVRIVPSDLIIAQFRDSIPNPSCRDLPREVITSDNPGSGGYLGNIAGKQEVHGATTPSGCDRMAERFKNENRKVKLTRKIRNPSTGGILQWICVFEGEDAATGYYDTDKYQSIDGQY